MLNAKIIEYDKRAKSLFQEVEEKIARLNRDLGIERYTIILAIENKKKEYKRKNR